MAWISDLAGKAENLLNKIDKNTAAVLSKEQNNILQQNDVTWMPTESSFMSSSVNQTPHESPSRSGHYMKLLQNLPITPSKSIQTKKDEYIPFLNTPTKSLINNGPSTPSSLSVEYSADNKDIISEYSVQSGRSSPIIPDSLIVDVPDIDNDDDDDDDDDGDDIIVMTENPPDIYAENARLKNELEELRNELLMTNHVEKSIESEQSGLLQKFDVLKQEYEYKLMQQRLEIEHLSKGKCVDNKKLSKVTLKNLEERNELLCRQYNDNQKEIVMLKEKLHLLEIENGQYLKQISDLKSMLERNRLDLQTTQQDLEQHRARALKTLQEKEKLISELRDNNSPIGLDNSTTNMELHQLKQECIVLREENDQVCKQLKIAREDLVNADLKIEETSRKIALANREAHEIILAERQKRTEAEDDARSHVEETRKLKDELASQLNNYTMKLRKQETEISRLRSQLSAISTPSSAVESRLSTLTQTLVTKQNELEHLTTEKNALRLQLEKIEHEYRKLLGNSRKPYNVNDTDDVKAQMPTFLIETPFDTGVTRRVKRAYSSLDAISVRIGRFLRSYPLARIFVIFYIGLLQFWVLIVLLFQSPDVHPH
ncbi:hypothetical protein PV326_004797 [Microctonus aethiopoides]|nr:hypothetical protein PV326_004797 [Microctonus aethiopoides]